MLKPTQTPPSFANGLPKSMTATLYFVQAQKAHAAGQWQQACVAAQACIAAAGHEEKMRNAAKTLLASGLTQLQQFQQALVILAELNALMPNDATVVNNIGLILTHLKNYDNAIKCFQRAIELSPNNIEFLMNLGFTYYHNRDFAQAHITYKKVTELSPKNITAYFGMGWALQSDGLVEEATKAYEQVLALDPHHLLALEGMIFMNYSIYPFDMQRQTRLTQQYAMAINKGSSFNKKKAKSPPLHPHSPLRIGIVSADFYNHVVCRFIISTLDALYLDPKSRSKLALIAYSNQSQEDGHTQRLKDRFDLWHRVDEWDDARLIQQIKHDKIDILIDLSGHTHGHRLPVFAKKAAPVQVSWLGYWGTTGLSQMDYVIADPISVPSHEENLFVEKIWRLPSLRYCFSAIDAAPPVNEPPCLKNNKITFGCYQTTTKINDGVLRLWSKILAASPTAQIRIQTLDFAKSDARSRFIERLNKANIPLNQVELVAGMGTQDYLASYSMVDILLDTFPYPGGATTSEALWMGVPTITLAMPGMLGRQGEALLINAGLADWVTQNEDQYIEKAIYWAQLDTQKCQLLAELRIATRHNVEKSPVYDAKKFSTDFVDALYGIWQDKCNHN